MTGPVWLAWFGEAGGLRSLQATLWRAVEAQHLIATMRLVDDAAEQAVLERLLERSKPPLPDGLAGLHFLVSTPYRYPSPHPSRFRRAHHVGIWYGAEDIRTTCAEVAYWRWRFVRDSESLADLPVHTQLTVFAATVGGHAVDLGAPPWDALAHRWRQPNDYAECQDLADAARARGVRWIRYRSVRDPEAGACGAVLDARALVALPTRQQTWACKASRTQVFLQHGHERLSFDASTWT